MHFSRLSLGNYDYLQLFDANDTLIQAWSPGNSTVTFQDFWSDYIPGRIVKVHLVEGGGDWGNRWGFRIDDIYPATEDPITPAGINGVYVQVNHPGTLYLNDAEMIHIQEQGEYKVLLSGVGEHHIRIEYMDYTQEILVTVTERGGIHVIYLPVQEKE